MGGVCQSKGGSRLSGFNTQYRDPHPIKGANAATITTGGSD
jgi:hypothetical protein